MLQLQVRLPIFAKKQALKNFQQLRANGQSAEDSGGKWSKLSYPAAEIRRDLSRLDTASVWPAFARPLRCAWREASVRFRSGISRVSLRYLPVGSLWNTKDTRRCPDIIPTLPDGKTELSALCIIKGSDPLMIRISTSSAPVQHRISTSSAPV